MLSKLFDLIPQKYGYYSDIEILPYLLRHRYVRCVVYGSNAMGIWLIDWLKKVYNITPEFIIDRNPQLGSINGIKVINYEDFIFSDNEKYFVIVADEKYIEPEYRKKLSDNLKEKGAVIIFNAYKVAEPFWPSWYVFIRENIAKFENVYNKLCDGLSKDTMLHYLKTYITGSRYDGVTIPEENKYWGKDDIEYSLFKIRTNEVVLNLGGGTGDTIIQFLKGGFPFEKIIAVESEKKNIEYIRRTIDLLDNGLKNKIQIDNFYIGEGVGVDDLYKDENISLIEMDIEGAEMSALISAVEVIKKNRPILAICAYHQKEDLIEIPTFIEQNFKDYVFALRKYPSSYFNYLAGIQQINELVLYAIPKERFIENKQETKYLFCNDKQESQGKNDYSIHANI